MYLPHAVRRTAGALAFFALLTSTPALAEGPSRPAASPAVTRTPAVPVWFEPNVGQFAPRVRFASTSAHARLALTDAGFDVTVAGREGARTLALRFAGAQAGPAVEGLQRLPGVSHYYIGRDRAAWREHVPQFGRVSYANVWTGIDAVVYGADDHLEYDFIVAPGRDPRAIALELEGADDMSIARDGSLLVSVGDARIVQRAPIAYQDVEGVRVPVEAAYRLAHDRVGFDIGTYDRTRPLVIDPIVIVYASFLGGSSTEFVEPGSQTAGIAIDGAGDIIVALDTNSTDLPGTALTALVTPNIAIVKINPTASAVLFTTYLGGNEFDSRGNIDTDPAGNIYLTGRTTSTDLPVTAGAIRTTILGSDTGDGLLAQFSSSGTLQYLTYIGGGGSDSAEAVSFANGKVYVTGSTSSTDLPATPNAAQATAGGDFDAWVARFDLSQPSPLEYLSYLGGSGQDAAFSLAVDGVGRFSIAGFTRSTGFPVSINARQTSLNGGADAFVTRFAANGSIDYSTYLGGSSASTTENAKVALDASGAFLLTGFTDSADFPAGTATPVFQATKAAGSDVFVARLDPSLAPPQQITARTFIGGSAVDGVIPSAARGDFAISVAQDASGNVYVTGFTSSSDFPVANATDSSYGGAYDVFVSKLDPTLSTLLFSTFVGGASDDRGYAVLVDATNAIHVLGRTASLAPFTPVAGGGGAPLDSSLGGSVDAFIIKFADSTPPTATGIAPLSGPTTGGTPFAITGTGFLVGASVTFGGTPATGVQVTSTRIVGVSPSVGGAGNVAVLVTNPDGQSATVTGGFTYVVPGPVPTVTGVVPNSGSIAGGTSVTITGTNFANHALTGVTFDLVAATNVVVVSATTITARTPAHGAGVVEVRVTNPDGGSSALVNGYTYVADADNDGIPDDWEVDNGLDPTDPTDAGEDADDDGASNEKEYQDGTDPNATETKYFAEGATIGIFTTQFAVANPDRFRTATTVFEFQTTTGDILKVSRTILPLQRVTVRPGTDVVGLEDAEFSTVIRSNLFVAADRTMTWDANVYGSHAETGVASPNATWYLAEGATIGSFNLFYLIQNPNAVPATVRVRYLLANGAPVEKDYDVAAKSRANIWVNFEEINGVSLANRELSAVLTTSASTPIIVERAMYLDAPGQAFNAGHESAGVNQPATDWFLAEGATGSFMDMFILVANPNPAPAHLTVQYLLTTGAPITRTYTADPNSRFNIWVDLEPGLEDVAVSTVIASDVPVIVERALWWPNEPASWYEAHNSPGTTATGQTWALGEGEVGGDNGFETYVLLANTSAFAGTARVTLLFEDGSPSVSKDVALPANSRVNVPIGEADAVGGFGAAAQNKRFGVLVESLGAQPAAIVVERAMYASQGSQFWAAGTNALAARVR